jgi:D-glucuronyl C5-epimerase C-terminus
MTVATGSMPRRRSALIVPVLAMLLVAGLAAPAAAAGPPVLSGASDDALLDGGIGAGLPSDGVAAPPSRDVRAVLRAQADPAPTGSRRSVTSLTLPTTPFTTGHFVPLPVPAPLRPYALTTPIAIVDTGAHDADGVRMFQVGSNLYDHPVAQANYGLANLASFDLTQDQRYLDRARAQAQRLVDTKVISRGAWYFPYPFDFELHGSSAFLERAPWYSAMAQGLALSLFVRLFQATADTAWMDAADGAAASFSNLPEADLPWVTQVDPAGYLWLEEYPMPQPADSDFTFNGHVFALFGLYDYQQETEDPVATQLFDGGVTTVLRYAPLASGGFRNPSWISRYCLAHGTLTAKYHEIVTTQLLQVQTATGDARFARTADRYRDDYPTTFASTVRFAAGTVTGYAFDAKGRITRQRTIQLSRTSSAPADRYSRIIGRGVYYHIKAGSLAGYWVPERAGRINAMGRYGETRYTPQRTAIFLVGKTTGSRFDSRGLPTSTRRITIPTVSSAPFDATAMYGGLRYAHITAGTLSGYWVPVSRLTL